MKYVVRYATVVDRAADLPRVFPLHKAFLDAFEPATDVIANDRFEDLLPNGSMAIFATLQAAQRFVEDDPFVTQGLVMPSEPVAWNA